MQSGECVADQERTAESPVSRVLGATGFVGRRFSDGFSGKRERLACTIPTFSGTPKAVPPSCSTPTTRRSATTRLSLWPWQTAVKAVFLERVDIVAAYEREVHSPSRAMRLPSVIALRQYVRPSEYPAFTRFNLFLRDRFACQYCGDPQELTFDHVVPRAQGGRTTWDNVATACAPCNLRKGGRTPLQAHMRIRRHPFRPTSWQLQEHGRSFPPNYLHESWRDYLYWDIELEA